MEFVAVILIVFALYLLETHIYLKYWSKGLEYRCYFTDSECVEGDETELVEEITNRKRLPIPWLKSEFSVPAPIDIIGAQSVVTDKTRFFSGYFFLRGCGRITRRRRVKLLKRGVYGIESIVLVASDVLGTLSLSMPVNKSFFDGKITVLPLPSQIDEALMLSEGSGGDEVRRFILPDPFLIDGVREYEYGDNARFINTAATATQGRLMVSKYSAAAIEKVIIVLFTYGLSESDAEECVKTAAAVCDELNGRYSEFALAFEVDGRVFRSEYGASREHGLDMMRLLAGADVSSPLPPERLLPEIIAGCNAAPDTMLCITAVGGSKGNYDKALEIVQECSERGISAAAVMGRSSR